VVGVVDGKTTSLLARELGCNRAWLVGIRRKLEAEVFIGQLKLQTRKVNDLWMSDLRKLLTPLREAPAQQTRAGSPPASEAGAARGGVPAAEQEGV
jgi:hypothetical protein